GISVHRPRSFAEISFTFLIAPSWFSFGVPASGHHADGSNVVHDSPFPPRAWGRPATRDGGENRWVEYFRQDIAVAARYGCRRQRNLSRNRPEATNLNH